LVATLSLWSADGEAGVKRLMVSFTAVTHMCLSISAPDSGALYSKNKKKMTRITATEMTDRER